MSFSSMKRVSMASKSMGDPGKELEAQELSVLVLFIGDAEDHVLRPYAESALDIEPRLVGADHTRFDDGAVLSLGNYLPADSVGALMAAA